MKSNILYTDIPDYELLSSEKTWYDQKILNKLVPLDKIKIILDEIIRQWMQKGQGQYFMEYQSRGSQYLTWKKSKEEGTKNCIELDWGVFISWFYPIFYW